MDVSSSDFSELDDWLGTLESLQHDITPSNPQPKYGFPKLQVSCKEMSHANQYATPFHHLPSSSSASSIATSSSHCSMPSRAHNKSTCHYASTVVQSTNKPAPHISHNGYLTPSSQQRFSSDKPPPYDNDYYCPAGPPTMRDKSHLSSNLSNPVAQSVRASFNTTSCKEATAESDLDCLLKELQIVEQKMKELEQSESDYTKRYSLASSTNQDRTPPGTATNSGEFQQEYEQSLLANLPSSHPAARPTTLPPTSILSIQSYDSGIQDPPSGNNNQSFSHDNLKIDSSQYHHSSQLQGLHLRGNSQEERGTADYSDSRRHSAVSDISHHTELIELDQYARRQQGSISSNSNCSFSSANGGRSINYKDQIERDRGSICSSLSASTQDYESEVSFEESPEITQKISEVMEKAEMLNLKKLVVRVFRPDKTTKAVLVDEGMTVGEICRMLTEKNFLTPSVKLSLVEKVPNLKIERILEDHEYLSNCILNWPESSKNMIFFEEKDGKYGLFETAREWLGSEYADNRGFLQKNAVKSIFHGPEICLPKYADYLYIKKPGEKTWARKYCIVSNSGLYASKKKKSIDPSDLVRIALFEADFHLYTTTGGWTKLKAPTPHGFVLKPYSAQDRHSKFVLYFCASDEKALHNWCSIMRIAKHGKQLLRNYDEALNYVNGTPCQPSPNISIASNGGTLGRSESTHSHHNHRERSELAHSYHHNIHYDSEESLAQPQMTASQSNKMDRKMKVPCSAMVRSYDPCGNSVRQNSPAHTAGYLASGEQQRVLVSAHLHSNW